MRCRCTKIAQGIRRMGTLMMRVPGAIVTSTSALPGSSDIRVIRVTSGIADLSMKTNAAGPKRRRDIASYLAAIRRARSVSDTSTERPHWFRFMPSEGFLRMSLSWTNCFRKKETGTLRIWISLKRSFPIYDCEVDALLEVVRGSHFIRSISYHSRTNQYFILFSNGDCRSSLCVSGLGEKIERSYRRTCP